MRVEAEQTIPGRDEPPADMLLSNWHGKTVAVDFTIITPTRQSALAQGAAAATTTTTLMDQAAKIKDNRSKELCRSHGWDLMPFVADSYGALRTDVLPTHQESMGTESPLLPSQPDGRGSASSTPVPVAPALSQTTVGAASLTSLTLKSSATGKEVWMNMAPCACLNDLHEFLRCHFWQCPHQLVVAATLYRWDRRYYNQGCH